MQVFLHRFFSYQPCKPRNPLLRLACGLVGVALLAVLVVFGLFIGLGMLMFAAVRRMTRPVQGPQARVDGAIDGEYTVVAKPQPSLHSH